MRILIFTLLLLTQIPAHAAYPVVPVAAEDQARLLQSSDPQLAANKRVAYDIYRYVMAGQLAPLEKLVSKDLVNHNPNEANGFDGLICSMHMYLLIILFCSSCCSLIFLIILSPLNF